MDRFPWLAALAVGVGAWWFLRKKPCCDDCAKGDPRPPCGGRPIMAPMEIALAPASAQALQNATDNYYSPAPAPSVALPPPVARNESPAPSAIYNSTAIVLGTETTFSQVARVAEQIIYTAANGVWVRDEYDPVTDATRGVYGPPDAQQGAEIFYGGCRSGGCS